jgi:DivIVA domain-containing protein
MGQLLLLLVGALVVAGIGFGVVVLITGGDPGLAPAEPDGRAVPLPVGRPLAEADLVAVRFDTAVRGYRMSQVDSALRRAAYDLGYKEELITVLMAEVDALRAGRLDDADQLRQARDQALAADRPATQSAPAIVVPEPLADAVDADAMDTEVLDADAVAAADGEPADETEAAAEAAPDKQESMAEWRAELDDAQQSMGWR